MNNFWLYSLLFAMLICLIYAASKLFWSFWEDCDEDELQELEKYRRNSDSN